MEVKAGTDVASAPIGSPTHSRHRPGVDSRPPAFPSPEFVHPRANRVPHHCRWREHHA